MSKLKIFKQITIISITAPILMTTVSCINIKKSSYGPGEKFENGVAHINISKNDSSYDNELLSHFISDWEKFGEVSHGDNDISRTTIFANFHNTWSYNGFAESDYNAIKHQNKYHVEPISYITANYAEHHYDTELHYDYGSVWHDLYRWSSGDFEGAQVSLTDDSINFIYNEISKGNVQEANDIYSVTGIDKDAHIFDASYMSLVHDNLTNNGIQHGVPYGSEGLGLTINQKAIDYFNQNSPTDIFDELYFGTIQYVDLKATIGTTFNELIDHILEDGWSYNQMTSLADKFINKNNLSNYAFYSNNYDTLHAINAKRYFSNNLIFDGITERNADIADTILSNNALTDAELKLIIEKNIELFHGKRLADLGKKTYQAPEFVFAISQEDTENETVVVGDTKKLPLPLYINGGDQLFNDIVIMPKHNMFWFNDRGEEIMEKSVKSQIDMLQTIAMPTKDYIDEFPNYLSPYSSSEYVTAFRNDSSSNEQLASTLVGNTDQFSYSLPGDFAIWYENIRSQYIIGWVEENESSISNDLYLDSSNVFDNLLESIKAFDTKYNK